MRMLRPDAVPRCAKHVAPPSFDPPTLRPLLGSPISRARIRQTDQSRSGEVLMDDLLKSEESIAERLEALKRFREQSD